MSFQQPGRLADTGEVSAVLGRAGQRGDPDVQIGATARILYLATGTTTDGQFGAYLCEFSGPDPGAVPHFHQNLIESFYILDGTMQLHDGTGWADATRDDWMLVPRRGIHGFRHRGDELARMLLLFTPGTPREAFFQGLAELAAGRGLPDGEGLGAFMARHDNYLVGPPPGRND
jgi:mannose-6-phosphate isomerase-like protein (cupin superfamily)